MGKLEQLISGEKIKGQELSEVSKMKAAHVRQAPGDKDQADILEHYAPENKPMSELLHY